MTPRFEEEFEEALPQEVRGRAIRMGNEVGWHIQDTEEVIGVLANLSIAIEWIEVWAVVPLVSPSDELDTLPPLGFTVDGAKVLGIIPMRDGHTGVLGLTGCVRDENQPRVEYVSQQANAARAVIEDARHSVMPELASKLFFELGVASQHDRV